VTGVELDANRPVLARRLDDDGEFQIVREVETPAERPGEDGRVDAVKLEQLLGDGLVLREHQPVRSRAGEPLADQLEVRGDAVISEVVAAERLCEIENEIALHARERVEALDRSVEYVRRRVVTELAERVGNFVLDFFLVECARQRRLLRRRGSRLLRFFPPVVQDDDVQFAHSVA
jgi:hypothetical protein